MKQLDYKMFPSEQKTIQVVDGPIYGGAHCYTVQHSKGFVDGQAQNMYLLKHGFSSFKRTMMVQ